MFIAHEMVTNRLFFEGDWVSSMNEPEAGFQGWNDQLHSEHLDVEGWMGAALQVETRATPEQAQDAATVVLRERGHSI